MKSILTGIDFTAASSAVLRHAVHAARLLSNPVRAVHVLDSGRIARWASAGRKTSADALAEQALGRLDAIIAEHAPDSGVVSEVRVGRAATELCRAVDEHDAGLLVIAANDLTKKRLGSVASSCTRCANCDVLVLRDWQEGGFKHIMVCADFSAMSARAMMRGVELAAANDAKLEIVHVLYPPDQDLWGNAIDVGEESEAVYATRCRERARREGEDFMVPHATALEQIDHQLVILESTVPSVALNSHLQDTGADLAILGTRGHSLIGGMFLGTNAERLLHDVAISVLAVRPYEADS